MLLREHAYECVCVRVCRMREKGHLRGEEMETTNLGDRFSLPYNPPFRSCGSFLYLSLTHTRTHAHTHTRTLTHIHNCQRVPFSQSIGAEISEQD